MEFDPSAYLRGRKVAVKLAIRTPDDEREIEECEVETVWLRLSNNEVAKIEEEFGGVIAFDEAYADRQVSTVRRVLAIAMGADVPLASEVLVAIGDRMIDTESPAYIAAVEAMWLISHGSPEEDAGKAWEARVAMAQQGHRMVMDAFQAALNATDSLGKNGTRRGRSSAGRTRSSGG